MKALRLPAQFIFLFALMVMTFSCQTPKAEKEVDLVKLPLDYAIGFEVFQGEGFKIIKVNKAFPGEHKPFSYLIKEDDKATLPEGDFDAVIRFPIQKVILTSTTQIPHLDYLGRTDYLIAFPNLNLISSEKARVRIDEEHVTDLGSGAQANIEKMIDLEPDWIMISTLGEDLRNLDMLKTAGIPAVINGEYVEQHPLGRAEWIKFTGALLGKWDEALAVFEGIKLEYEKASQLVKEDLSIKPSVMAGVMYKDIWYVPGSESWGAQLLEAAGGQYLFEDQKGTGSAQMSYEYVLDKAIDADFWLGASDFKNLTEMGESDPRYKSFKAFQKGEIYTYTLKKGATGGVEYFELGYLRPDLILQDLIKILHPTLLPDYQLYFYTKLEK